MCGQEWKWNKGKNISDLLGGAHIWVTLVSFDVISLNASILKLAITHIFQIFKNSISRKMESRITMIINKNQFL